MSFTLRKLHNTPNIPPDTSQNLSEIHIRNSEVILKAESKKYLKQHKQKETSANQTSVQKTTE